MGFPQEAKEHDPNAPRPGKASQLVSQNLNLTSSSTVIHLQLTFSNLAIAHLLEPILSLSVQHNVTDFSNERLTVFA